MAFTDVRSWQAAHEIIECKALKGRWTLRTCLEISKRGQRKAPRSGRSQIAGVSGRVLPCANCPILAALEDNPVHQLIARRNAPIFLSTTSQNHRRGPFELDRQSGPRTNLLT